jgi:hypothetical protein
VGVSAKSILLGQKDKNHSRWTDSVCVVSMADFEEGERIIMSCYGSVSHGALSLSYSKHVKGSKTWKRYLYESDRRP